MNIGVAKSTYAFMLADPLCVLEEDEIHLGFSSDFGDPKDICGDNLLHDIDVLVARCPAVLSSDIQKAGWPEPPRTFVFFFFSGRVFTVYRFFVSLQAG